MRYRMFAMVSGILLNERLLEAPGSRLGSGPLVKDSFRWVANGWVSPYRARRRLCSAEWGYLINACTSTLTSRD